MTSSPSSKPQMPQESRALTQHTQLQNKKGAELPLGANPEQTQAPSWSTAILLPFAWGSSWHGDFGGAPGAVPSTGGGRGMEGSRCRADVSRDFSAELARVAADAGAAAQAGVFAQLPTVSPPVSTARGCPWPLAQHLHTPLHSLGPTRGG